MDMPGSQEDDYIPFSSDSEDSELVGTFLDQTQPAAQISDRPAKRIDEDRRLEDWLSGLVATHIDMFAN